MPVDMNIKLEGITGESKHYLYKGWSEVSAWSWGMQQQAAETPSTASGPEFKKLAITKRIGIDSTELMMHFALGKTINSAEFVITPVTAKREAKQKYLSVLMQDVTIQSIQTGGDNSELQFLEHVVLDFSRVRFEYSFNIAPTQESPQGSSKDYVFGWDTTSGQPWS